MIIYYRISDSGYDKVKPEYINNKNCLNNFISVFGLSNLNIIADNVNDDTFMWISSLTDKIDRTQLGSGAQSFNYVLDKAIDLPDDEVIYFVENDYLHKQNSDKLILEGIKLGADYVTLYDHPDKYLGPESGGNPFVDDGGEVTKVYLSDSCHWKLTNSTTMTFASKVRTLKEDEHIFRKWTDKTYPEDFKMFLELRDTGRTLISPLPGYSTHGEVNGCHHLQIGKN